MATSLCLDFDAAKCSSYFFGSPGEQILAAFRHLRHQFEQHDGFVEVIEIVGGEAGARIDVRFAQACLVRGVVDSRFASALMEASRKPCGNEILLDVYD